MTPDETEEFIRQYKRASGKRDRALGDLPPSRLQRRVERTLICIVVFFALPAIGSFVWLLNGGPPQFWTVLFDEKAPCQIQYGVRGPVHAIGPEEYCTRSSWDQ